MTEFEAQNAGIVIPGLQISNIFRGGGGGVPPRGIGMSHRQGIRLDPRLKYSELFQH